MAAKDKRACAQGVCNPNGTGRTEVQLERGKDYTLIKLEGPGVFVAATVTKQGGETGLTFVNLKIDGRNVVSSSYAGAKNTGLTQHNPSGIVLLKTQELETFTIGFPTPLRFEKELVLSVYVNENGIVQIVSDVVHGTAY